MNDGWKLHDAPLFWDASYLDQVKASTGDWMTCDVPADVRMPLMEVGKVRDPVLADYCFESEWIEKRSWWFFRDFDISEDEMNCEILELVLEMLDCHSDVFVNGQHIGRHISVHYPFVYNIENLVCLGKNELAVRVTTGLESVSDEDLSELNWAVCREQDNGGKYRSDYRRSFVRRPQYTVGWDWGPRVVTCGITGDVYLRGYNKIAIREVSCNTVSTDGHIKIMVNVDNLNIISTATGCVKAEILYEGVPVASAEDNSALFTSGLNYFDFDLYVKKPKLWWPADYGDQPLYTVRIIATCEDVTEEHTLQYGIRTVELDTSAIPVLGDEHRNFFFIVNGVKVFCKGGNWIPNDCLYPRVSEDKYRTLIDEARGANFNMLRIWGGGLYERDIFYQLCNESGILVWHDFMFACTTYPDHKEWFRQVVAKELDYQTKRLRNHCSIVLFCGSNENHWLFNKYETPKWGIDFTHDKQYGMYIYNSMAKEAVRKNCSSIPYWNSSPYGGALTNDETVGDVHWWRNGFMSHDMNERIEPKDYDNIEAKFVSEYGYVGPCSVETMKKYLCSDSIDRSSLAWEIHNNVFEKETVFEGIRKQYLDTPEDLSIENYVLYGGMVHGLMLGYSLEAIRFKEHCGGGVFWMYNDTWGEVGWTIIDYYLNRKIPYYAVKRSFAPVKFSMRIVNDELVVQACNEFPRQVEMNAMFGYKSFDGKIDECEQVSFVLPPHSRTYVHRESLPEKDYRTGSIVLMPEDALADSVMLRVHDTRNLEFTPGDIIVLKDSKVAGGRALKLTSNKYVHGAYIKGEYKCSDNYFDIIPGEVKNVFVECPDDIKIEVGKVYDKEWS